MNHIAQPLQMKHYKLKNRLVKGAMSEALANDAGDVNQLHLGLYQRWAEGGLGASITGNVMVDHRAKNEPGVVVVEDESNLEQLKKWADIGKKHNMMQLVQLSHPGRQCPKGLNKETVSASAVPFSPSLSGMFPTPRALQQDEILDIITRFGVSAKVCQKAGFEGIQLHGAHGYLISQFLSPLTNLRQDQWGGSIENRSRFLLEVYKEVRRQTGDDFIISVKLNSADFQRGGFDEEDALHVFQAIDKAGIDFIEISGGTYEKAAMAGVLKKSTVEREAYFLDFAEKVRSLVKAPLMVTGGFRSTKGMNQALNSGACDLIGMARPLAVEIDAPNNLISGQDIRHATKPIKSGVPFIDNGGLLEVVWYAAQFRTIATGKQPNPKLSPYKVLFNYSKNNIRAVVTGRLNSRAK